jgi:hypothetical protein
MEVLKNPFSEKSLKASWMILSLNSISLLSFLDRDRPVGFSAFLATSFHDVKVLFVIEFFVPGGISANGYERRRLRVSTDESWAQTAPNGAGRRAASLPLEETYGGGNAAQAEGVTLCISYPSRLID